MIGMRICQPDSQRSVYCAHLPIRQKGPHLLPQCLGSCWLCPGGGGSASPSALCSPWELVQNRAQAGWKPEAEEFTAWPLILALGHSLPVSPALARVNFVPLFPKLQVDFCRMSWGRRTTIRTPWTTPLPLKVQPRTKSTLVPPFLAVVFSPLITIFSPPISSLPWD